jgi:hypothetical protein
MTNPTGHLNAPSLEALRRYVPLVVWIVVILTILVIPLKIISYGFLPGDDALRHAAKAVSGRPWPDILVLGPSFQIDHNVGWHLFLRQIFLWSDCTIETLVVFSVVFLFVVAGWSALPWLKRPEVWLIALIATGLASPLLSRLLMGRPFLLTIAGLLTVLFLWQTCGPSPPKWRTVCGMAGMIAICIFVHGVWYLWALPVAAFFLAGQYRWGAMLTVACAMGSFLGASLTGHPFEALYQAVEMAWRAFALHITERTLVIEFQPADADLLPVIIMGGLLILRQLAKLNARPLTVDPVFWLAALSWVLGFKARRFMDDWGWPALMVWIAGDMQLLLLTRFAADSFKRLALTGGLALIVFMVFTSDIDSRWTQNLTWTYLTPDNKNLTGWLPEKGGIFYTADMTLFYQTFFKNPNADWRYILGYEPALMRDEDFAVYHKILWNSGDPEAYLPWVNQMRPADRLVIRGGNPPDIPRLEWYYVPQRIWIGRLPDTNAPAPAPTIPAKAAGGPTHADTSTR